jgi:NAD(P)H-hydrate epimerase
MKARLTREQVRQVDRLSIEQYHIPGIVLMENAARAVSAAAVQMLAQIGTPRALVVCGGGNNGGDGLAVARLLHNAGCDISIALTVDPAGYQVDALINWRIVQAMKLPAAALATSHLAEPQRLLLIDAIFATGLSQAPRDPFPSTIAMIEQSRPAVLAVDLPSGLDCDTGEPLGPACIRADRTVSFVAEKAGFANPSSRQYTGLVTVGDIGCPRAAIEQALRDHPLR